jgi:GxxExxY protein
MAMNTSRPILHEPTTELILKAFYQVYNALGYGFLERVYAAATAHALRKLGLTAVRELPIRVEYDGITVGEYQADLVVNDAVLVEIKAARALAEEHEAQLLNYLRATRFEVGLLLNFGPEPQFQRRVFQNARKGQPSRAQRRAGAVHRFGGVPEL